MTLAARFERRVGDRPVRVDLEVAAGEVLALLGPNGAGKSTVLRCLAGLAPVDSGVITIDGHVVDATVEPGVRHDSVFVDSAHRSVGMVFQDHLLFPNRSVLDNVAYGLRARGARARSARGTAQQMLERLELTELADRRPHQLSGGQSQRVALARALATGPRLLLLDEPLAALDVSTRSMVRRELRQHLQSFEGACVLVTHDPIDAYALADRVAVIDEGQIVQTGTLADVTAHPRSRFVAELVGVNLVEGSIHGGILHTPNGAQVVVVDAVAGPSFAVITPQSVLLTREPITDASARNTWCCIVTGIDRLGDRSRVILDGALPLVAEITTSAAVAMGLRPGDTVYAAVKATDIEVYPA